MISDGYEEMKMNPSLNDGYYFYINEDLSNEKEITVEELSNELSNELNNNLNKELLNDINYEVDLNKLSEFILELENLDTEDLEKDNTD